MRSYTKQTALVILVLSMTFISACDKDSGTSSGGGSNNPNNPANQGKGTVTLVSNGSTFVIAGNCNYSDITDAIVVSDSTNNKNVFLITLEDGLPAATKTYPVVAYADTDKDKASISFTRFPGGNEMNTWSSNATSGSVTLTVTGNKITCSLSNITLEPSIIYNPDNLKFDGTCSGSFTLYK